MRVSIIAFALVATVAATPFPWAQPQGTGAPVPVVSARPNATKSHAHHHHEPTPSFGLGCECAQPIIPVDKLSAKEKCQMEFSNKMGCYYRSQGGCAKPTLAC